MSKLIQTQELTSLLTNSELMERAGGKAAVHDPVSVGRDPAVPGLASSGAAPCERDAAEPEAVQGAELHSCICTVLACGKPGRPKLVPLLCCWELEICRCRGGGGEFCLCGGS